MRRAFAETLRCPECSESFLIEVGEGDATLIHEGVLRSRCGRRFPVIAGVPRILPEDLARDLVVRHPGFFQRHPELRQADPVSARCQSVLTQRAFGGEWQRFPEMLPVHEGIFRWYFDGPRAVEFAQMNVLDAGCGMGRWLHFVRKAGGRVVGMDSSSAVDVAAAREGQAADFVQADLRWPPFAPATFDLVYSFGVLHHLEDPAGGARVLSQLIRPGGELRLYVYRSLEDEGRLRRLVLSAVTQARRVTTRLPFWALHVVSWLVSAIVTVALLAPRRALRRTSAGDRLSRDWPLVQYVDVPFRMLVAEQFDRLGAPLEGRYRSEEVRAWLEQAGLEVEAILPELGWRAIARRPLGDVCHSE